MADFVVNGDMFGRYVRIPTGYNEEMHVYKVVSLIKSNSYCNTPILCTSAPVLHGRMMPVLNVIHCGIDESKVVRVALVDCEIILTSEDKPRWIPVTEQLPKPGDGVLVFTPEGHIGIDMFDIEDGWFWNAELPPSHWMPLPEMPASYREE